MNYFIDMLVVFVLAIYFGPAAFRINSIKRTKVE